MSFKILVTGSAGFIGYHLVDRLLKEERFSVVGLDVINDYYDINLKFSRLDQHGINGRVMSNRDIQRSSEYLNYRFLKVDLVDYDFVVDFMVQEKFDFVVNLAAQAGVRYSIENPRAYTHSNIDGFLSILEGCRYSGVKHLVYASTSSVYGLNSRMPLSERESAVHPMSFYSATKRANELMAHTYSHLFRVPTTGLRFFTVYGPWGRPDMALFLFSNSILKGEPISVFNHGKMVRDFTYIDDVVEAIYRVIFKPADEQEDWNGEVAPAECSTAPYRIFNVGNSRPIALVLYIEYLERYLEIEAKKIMMDIQPGDVPITHSDSSSLENLFGYRPVVSVEEGVKRFVLWFKDYYNV